MEKPLVTGSSQHLKEKLPKDAFVMLNITILGRETTLYLAPKTGKARLSLWRQQILAWFDRRLDSFLLKRER